MEASHIEILDGSDQIWEPNATPPTAAIAVESSVSNV